MGLSVILAFGAAALAARWLVPPRWRLGFVLLVSLGALVWLQPSSPVRGVAAVLPLLSVGLTVLTWAATQPSWSDSCQRIFEWIPVWAHIRSTRFKNPLAAMIVSIIIILLVLKTPALLTLAAAAARRLSGQNAALASPLDIQWLGFSYLAFRLLHVLREKQAGKLPAFTLPEFAAYALFFPAYTAGPIDRAPRFITELRQRFSSPAGFQAEARPAGFQAEARPLAVADTLMGGQRILWGVFKKFVLADSLAIFALNAQNASQVQSAAWAWVMLLGYTLRIYLDFSGYTDTAIGLGQIIGLKLPENFARPYLQPNLTAFWNSWHMTLAQWFRAYYFNPLTRWLRTRPAKLSIGLVVFITQLSTMMLIGLWHGVTINFLMWGAWHGLGLFIHNRYLEWLRPYQDALEARPRLAQAMRLTGWAATFVFVMLGWVWFALPGFGQAITFFGKLI